MVQILNFFSIAMLMLATSVSATARYSYFYQDNICNATVSTSFKMGDTGCFNVGHAMSYKTANNEAPGQAPGGKWCLIKYRTDTCNCIDDYEVVDLEKGVDSYCHTLPADPYHGAYHWHKMDESGTCPISGCYDQGTVNTTQPDLNKKGSGFKMIENDPWALNYAPVIIAKRRLGSK